ncbi:MFS general substrate transporter [Rhizoctonia solani]|nr:MFS general substrate transporter [Rhizoctonia solani]
MSDPSPEFELGVLTSNRLPSKSSFASHVNPTPSDRTENAPGSSVRDNSQAEIAMSTVASELLPVDVGFGAWSFVASAFILDTIIWGFGFTYGVFQEYFIREKTFGNASEAALGAVGTLSLGLQYCSALLVIVAAQQWRHRIPLMMWVCLGICVASLLCASFTNKVWQLIILQGVCFGIGGGGLYAPVILPEWFSVRKGLAAAIIFGGAGAGGTVYPLATNYLLESLGFRWTLRIWAAFTLVLCTVSLLFMKPRLPANRPSGTRRIGFVSMIRRHNWSFLRSPLFVCISITSFVQALAYFPVSLYMSVYTTSLGLPTVNGTIVVAIFNLASVTGQVIFGHFCDIAPYPYVIIISGAGASLSAYLLWGFAHNLGVIFAFVIIFGLMLLPPTLLVQSIKQQCLEGSAAVIGPVIAAALHHPDQSSVKTAYSGYGFRDVTLFVGSMMLATAAGGVSSKFLSRH